MAQPLASGLGFRFTGSQADALPYETENASSTRHSDLCACLELGDQARLADPWVRLTATEIARYAIRVLQSTQTAISTADVLATKLNRILLWNRACHLEN